MMQTEKLNAIKGAITDGKLVRAADNPIEYTEGVPLINNAFYRVDGVIKVYMDGWVDWEG